MKNNHPSSTVNIHGTKPLFSHMATYTAAIATALSMTATSPAWSQGKDKAPNSKNVSTNTLDYVLANVGKYFPDMKEHTQNLIKSISTKERKDAVNDILNKTVMKANDEKQRIGGCIYAIETYVPAPRPKPPVFFGDKYDSEITDATFALMDEFNKQYDIWFDAYVARLEASLPQKQAELAKNKAELAKIVAHIELNMGLFTPEQVKKNPKLKTLVLETEAVYKKRNDPIPEHLQLLIQATK